MDKHSRTRGPQGGKRRGPQPEDPRPQAGEVETVAAPDTELRCPRCGEVASYVYRTEVVAKGRRRWRVCRACGKLFRTLETPQ